MRRWVRVGSVLAGSAFGIYHYNNDPNKKLRREKFFEQETALLARMGLRNPREKMFYGSVWAAELKNFEESAAFGEVQNQTQLARWQKLERIAELASRKNPREKKVSCFISYAHGDSGQEQWVMRLAYDLTAAGVAVFLDKFTGKIGLLDHLLTKQCELADFVLVVGTESYKRKMLQDSACVLSKEWQIIREKIQETNQIPLLLAGDVGSSFPGELLGRASSQDSVNPLYFDFRQEADYEEKLIKLLTGLYGLGANELSDEVARMHQGEQRESYEEKCLDIEDQIRSNVRYFLDKRGKVIRYNIPGLSQTFVGRQSKLLEIRRAISGNQPVLLAALNGLGGVGKSQLAIKYVYDHQYRYPGGVFWFNAENESQLSLQYQELARDLDINVSDLKAPEIIAEVKKELERRNDWLIIFDNAENQESLKPFLPAVGGRVIITSRYAEFAGSRVDVSVFELAEAIDYVKKATGFDATPEVLELIELLGRLPLALAQACAYIRSGRKTVGEYLDFYKTSRTRLLEINKLKGLSTPEVSAVAVTWDVTVEKIKQENPKAIQLLNFIAYLNADGIPYFLLQDFLKQESVDGVDADEAINILLNYSMLNRGQDGSYNVHRLVQEVTRDKHSPEVRVMYLSALSKIMKARYPDMENKTEDQDLKKKLMPHIEQGLCTAGNLLEGLNNQKVAMSEESGRELLIERLEKGSKDQFLHCLGEFAWCQGDAKKAESYWEQLLVIRKKYYESEHVVIAMTLMHLGNAYGDLGDNEKAREYLEESLSIFKRCYGAEHIIVAKAMVNLGTACRVLGCYEKAREYLEESLYIFKKCCGAEHREVGRVLNNLGNLYGELRDHQKRREYLEQALPVLKKHYGANHVVVAKVLGNLGNAYGALGDYEKKKACLEETLQIKKDYYGLNHVEVAKTKENLGNVHAALGNHEQAKQYLEESLRIKKEYYGVGHVEVAKTKENLGPVYLALGSYQKARKYLEAALKTNKAYYGFDHAEVAETLRNLGVVYGKLGDHENGKKYLEEALRIEKRCYGAEHSEVGVTLLNLGDACRKEWLKNGSKEELRRGRELLEESYKILSQHPNCGPSHPDTKQAKERLEALDQEERDRQRFVLNR